MKIVCISDTHCQLNKIYLPEGDMIIHAGDALSHGTYSELVTFLNRYEKTDYKHKIYIPGNHDRISEINEELVKQECVDRDIIYLNDLGITIEGIKFWGSGVTPRFHDWAWNRDSGEKGTSKHEDHPSYNPIDPHWDKIPDDVDVLITHGPPHGILDISVYSGDLCGCEKLLEVVNRVKPRYHIFGHIHHYHGTKTIDDTTFINASICTESYRPTNKPFVIEIEEKK